MIQFIKKYWLFLILGAIFAIGAWYAASDLSRMRDDCLTAGNDVEFCDNL